jgi:hypothetical protein
MTGGVQFDSETPEEGGVLYGRFERSNKAPWIVTWLMSIGVAKNTSQANYILLAITATSFLLSIYFFTDGFASFGSSPTNSDPNIDFESST